MIRVAATPLGSWFSFYVYRGCRCAQPPDSRDNVPTLEGSQLLRCIFINTLYFNVRCDPAGVGTLSSQPTGGVAALNPRLTAGKPSGLLKTSGLMWIY